MGFISRVFMPCYILGSLVSGQLLSSILGLVDIRSGIGVVDLGFLAWSSLVWVFYMNYCFLIYFLDFVILKTSIITTNLVYFICFGYGIVVVFQLCVFFGISYLGIGLVELGLEVVRILIFIIFRPSVAFADVGKEFHIDIIPLFDSVIHREFTEAGFFMGVPFFLESMFLLFIHFIFQCYWVFRLIIFYFVELSVSTVFDLIFLIFFSEFSIRWTSTNFGLFLPGIVNGFYLAPLWVFLMLIIFWVYRLIIIKFPILTFNLDRFRTRIFFINRVSIFNFFIQNRGFGLNLFPHGSLLKFIVYSTKMRYSSIADIPESMESLIVFTSELRVDPKQVELDAW